MPRLLQINGIDINNCSWMQDGHPTHHTRPNMHLLQRLFRNRVISLGARVEWPPRSPDLNPLDFFLWGHLKSIIYRYPLETIEQLRQRITEALQSVTPEMLERCYENLIKRARLCIEKNGGLFEQCLT